MTKACCSSDIAASASQGLSGFGPRACGVRRTVLTGDDLAALGMQPGPRLGAVLESVYRPQLNEQIETRQDAASMALKMMN